MKKFLTPTEVLLKRWSIPVNNNSLINNHRFMKSSLTVLLLLILWSSAPLPLSAQGNTSDERNLLAQERREFLVQIGSKLPMEVEKGIVWKSARLDKNNFTFTYLVLKNGPYLKGVTDETPVIVRLKTMPVDKLLPNESITGIQTRLDANVIINLKIAGWWQQGSDDSEVNILRRFPKQLRGKEARYFLLEE